MRHLLASLTLSISVTFAPALVHARENGALSAGAAKFLAAVKSVANHSPLARVAVSDRAKDRAAILAGRNALAQSGHWVGHQVVHFVETSVLLGTLAAVEAVIQERHLAPLRDESTATVDVMARAASNLFNDTSLYASIVGGTVASTLTSYPVGKLSAEILAAVPNEYLGRLMAGGVSTFVSFVGWEAGSRLWEEAIYNMALDANEAAKTPEELARVEADITLARQLRFLDLIRGKGTADEKRVFKIVWNNALEILNFSHPERTAAWMENTLRLNIFTGEFVTGVTMMSIAGTTASMASTTLLAAATGASTGAKVGGAMGFLAGPAGSVVVGVTAGLVGGIAGGVAAHYTPEEFKKGVTNNIRRTQLQRNSVQLANSRLHLEDARTVYAYHGAATPPHWAEEIHRTLVHLRAIRDAMGTTLFMQIYEAATQYQEAEVTLAAVPNALAKTNEPAKQAEIRALEKEFGKKFVKTRRQSEKFINKLLALYDSELAYFAAWSNATPALPTFVRDEIAAQYDDLLRAKAMLTYFYAGLFPDRREWLGVNDITDADLPQVSAASNVLLNQFYLRGYQERQLIEPPKAPAKELPGPVAEAS